MNLVVIRRGIEIDAIHVVCCYGVPGNVVVRRGNEPDAMLVCYDGVPRNVVVRRVIELDAIRIVCYGVSRDAIVRRS
jgi:hypothetical protein